jgi:hypothetical protein
MLAYLFVFNKIHLITQVYNIRNFLIQQESIEILLRYRRMFKMERLPANAVRNKLIGEATVIGKVKNTWEYIVSVGGDWYSLRRNQFEDPSNIGIQDKGYLYYQCRIDRGSFYFSKKKLPEIQYEEEYPFS